ncbi:MAG TPA: metallophosphoesterase [Isosphaeraceae bacterium]|nr:metallophosphoesterase [Isosphaeraceae bacterium]
MRALSMLMLAISDLHGDMASAKRAIQTFNPELILCCGDWGDSNEVEADDLALAMKERTVFSTFGNHDRIETLAQLRNPDGSAVLLEQGEVRRWRSWSIAAIGGIWAKSYRKPFYVTDEDVRQWAELIARTGPVDILLTHGCPLGMADLTPAGRHGGQRCFLSAFQTVQPSIHLCGHLHRVQEYRLKDGRQVVNAGQTSDGDVVTIDEVGGRLLARLARFE